MTIPKRDKNKKTKNIEKENHWSKKNVKKVKRKKENWKNIYNN